MSGFVIRGAQADEHDEIAHVWQESWRATGLTHLIDPSWEFLRARIAREMTQGWSLFAAVEEGAILGFVALRRADNFLDQLFVLPECQGCGVGRSLLAFTRTCLPDEIWLRCASENGIAWRWYEREGFVFEKEDAHEVSGMMLRYYRWKRT